MHSKRCQNFLQSSEMRNKRETFLHMMKKQKYRATNHWHTNQQILYTIKIEKSLQNIFGVVNKCLLDKKLACMRRIKSMGYYFGEVSKKSAMKSQRVKGKSRNISQWKQNSNYNILDISLENRRLRQDIKKQKLSEQAFAEKMSALLDVHQRPKTRKK